jgi:aminopeptidase N
VLATSAQALKYFSETFGPLTRTSLSIVEAEFPDGMEYDGLYFLGNGYYSTYFGGPQNFLTTLGVHETAHQWWYGLVANDQALEPWLDEALATYSELLYFETFYPELVEWWWEFRVGLYSPEGYLDSSIYQYDGFRPYVNAAYLRGAQFLDELRTAVGDEAFMSTLRTLINRASYDQLTTASFLELLGENTSADISPLIEEYFQDEPFDRDEAGLP